MLWEGYSYLAVNFKKYTGGFFFCVEVLYFFTNMISMKHALQVAFLFCTADCTQLW